MKSKRILFLISLLCFGLLSTSLWAVPDFIGNVIGGYTPANFPTYWNQVTSENAAKWGSVESSRDRYNWSPVDSHVNYAKSHGYPYKFHTLVWGSQYPTWITSLSQTEQRAEVEEWIRDVANRYQPDMIDVVNEPLHAPAPYRNALGGSGSTGWDWVVTSFQLARQHFPNSTLLLNDYGIISDSSAVSRYMQIVKALQDRNLIDGIGIQCHHFNVDTASASTLTRNLDTLGSTGLPIYVSELDITGDDNTQLSRYRTAFPAFYNHPSVKGITVWGYIVGETWRDQTGLVRGSNVGAAERPAMQWLKQYLGGEVITPTPAVPTPTPNPNANVTVRASSTVAGAHLEVHVNGTSVETFTLTTSMQNYTTEGHGQIELHFTNDDQVDSGMDVQVDYLVYDGVTFQAEDQETNTAVWQDDSCGGSYSEMMHCNGYIRFDGTGDPATPTPINTPTVTVTPSPPPTGGDAQFKIVPATKSVLPNSKFTLAITLSSEDDKVAAYGISVNYDDSYLSADTATDSDAVDKGDYGFIAAANASESGVITVSGFDVSGVGPGSDLDFLTLFFAAGSRMGTSNVGITINNLTSPAAGAIQGTAQGSTITIEEIAQCITGDGNGDGSVDIVDALLAAQTYVSNIANPNSCLDVNCDGSVDIIDALLIAQCYVGMSCDFC